MTIRSALVLSLVLAGAGLIGYGLYVGDEGTTDLVVEGIEEDVSPPDEDTVEYDYLRPDMQDTFREAVETGGDVRFDGPVPDAQYVEYRAETYRIYVVYGTANMTTMFFSILGGAVLLVLAGLLWIHPVEKLRQRR